MRFKLLFLILFLIHASDTLLAQTMDLERVSPESQGIHSNDLSQLFQSLLATPNGEVHGVTVLRHGKVIGELFPEPFRPEYHHTLYSASKTFVAAAIGLAIQENKLRLNDRVATFFPELLPDTVSRELASITVKDLLTMTTGIIPDWTLRNHDYHWVQSLLHKKVNDPGKTFRYDSMASYLLSAILQRVTGDKLIDYLKPRLFHPMHITEVYWEESPEHINTGGWGLYLQVESMAKFGQLLLDHGQWEGKQLLPTEWVNEMTQTVQETSHRDSYGYQLWHCQHPNAYRADGAFGQYIIVSPDEDMVIALTQANNGNGVYEQQLIWNFLKKATNQTIQEGNEYISFQKEQREYKLPTLDTKKRGTIIQKTINLPNNSLDWKSIQISKDNTLLKITTTDNTEYSIEADYQRWKCSTIKAYPPYSIKAINRMESLPDDFKVAARYGWKDDGTLLFQVRYVNWITSIDIQIKQVKKHWMVTVHDITKKTPVLTVEVPR